MEHSNHKPGTVRGCKQCASEAYEPGWYAAMLSLTNHGTVVVDLTGSVKPAATFTSSR